MHGQLEKLANSDGSGGFGSMDIRTSATGPRERPQARHSVARAAGRATLRPKWGTLTISGGSANSTPSCVHRVGSHVLFQRVESDRDGRGAVRP
jgi:hypothetical protein